LDGGFDDTVDGGGGKDICITDILEKSKKSCELL
jgi:hypothetical protein